MRFMFSLIWVQIISYPTVQEGFYCIKRQNMLGMVLYPLILAHGRQRQENRCDLEGSLVYTGRPYLHTHTVYSRLITFWRWRLDY